jgi:hypothetical protein
VLFLGFPDKPAQTKTLRAARTILPSQRHDFLERDWLRRVGAEPTDRPQERFEIPESVIRLLWRDD